MKSDYPDEFEKIWEDKTPSRLSGRKEAGFNIYCRMSKQLKEKDDRIKELEKDAGDIGTIAYLSASHDCKKQLTEKDELLDKAVNVINEYVEYHDCFCPGHTFDCIVCAFLKEVKGES